MVAKNIKKWVTFERKENVMLFRIREVLCAACHRAWQSKCVNFSMQFFGAKIIIHSRSIIIILLIHDWFVRVPDFWNEKHHAQLFLLCLRHGLTIFFQYFLIFFSVAEPKLFIFGSGSSSSYSHTVHILTLTTVLKRYMYSTMLIEVEISFSSS